MCQTIVFQLSRLVLFDVRGTSIPVTTDGPHLPSVFMHSQLFCKAGMSQTLYVERCDTQRPANAIGLVLISQAVPLEFYASIREQVLTIIK